MLLEVENNKSKIQEKNDYQYALDEIKAQKFNYQARINFYQYQILLFEILNNKFNDVEILQVISIFNQRVTNLVQELKLKKKYPDYYNKNELQKIKDAIKDGKEKLEMFLKIKEKDNATNDFINFTNIS